MKRTIILFTLLILCCLCGQAQYYYCYNRQRHIILTDTVLLVNDNPFVDNYLSNNSTALISRNNKYAIVAGREKAQNENMIVHPVFKTLDGELLGCNGQIIFWPTDQENIERIVQSFPIEIIKTGTSYVLAKVLDSTENSDLSVANALQESGLVLFSHPNFVVNIQQCTDTIDDTYFPYQFYLHSIGQTINDGHVTTIDADINAPEAWNITNGISSIKIAVIDDGVTSNHPDLPNTRQLRLPGSNLAAQYDGSSENDPSPVGSDKHGTACAGIIAATHNNEGIAGIAQNCMIMPIRVSFNDVAVNDFADAIDFAVNNGADIISNSWGKRTSETNAIPGMVNAINNATLNGRNGKGCIVVFSAGNTANRIANKFGYVKFPANCSNETIITVGASDRNNLVANYSPNGDKISVVAPSSKALPSQILGETGEVWSIDRPGSDGYNPNENNSETLPSSGVNFLSYTGRFGGTSAACPQVAGVAGLMLSTNVNLTANEVKFIIESTTKKIGTTPYQINNTHPNGTWNQEMGYGLVDAHKAVVYAMEYGYDLTILGDSTLSDCDIKTYSCDILHPELFTYVWSATPNLSIINDNDCSVNIAPVSTGIGTVTVDVYQQERLMYTLTKSVNVTSIWSVITPVSTVPFHVSSNTTWSSKLSLPVPVTIDSLATLTIADTLFCTPAARIIVRPGGKLIVDGGTLTSACADGMWQGVYVEGHRDQPQTAANQGTVQLLNGAVVENAIKGIRTSAPGSGWNTTGGIITADNATFRNCAKAVEYLSYAGTNYAGLVIDNKGSFTNCTFTVDDNNLFAANGTDLLAHVSLWDVKGVEFTHCRFEDARTENHSRKSAISALDAGFEMKTGCSYNVPRPECDCPPASSTHSSFAGFGTAIDAGTSGSPYGIVIDGAQFSDNITGVRIEGSSHATVTRCTFDLSDMPVRVVTGLCLDGCTGYLVEENTFTRGASAPNGSRYGIRVGNSGTDANGLYRNTFERLSHGIYVTGTNGDDNSNTGLQMTCNGFTNNAYDIYVASGATMGPSQGDNSKGADNTFSGTQTSSLYNAGSQRIDYYYSPGTNHSPQNPVGNVTLHANAGGNDCASTLCVLDPSNPGPGSKSPTPSFLALKQQYENLMADFNRNGYADILSTAIPPQSGGTPNVNQETIEAAQYASQQINSIAAELYAQSHAAVRALMADTLEDLQAVMAWLDATPGLASRYLEAETEFKLGGNNISLADIANHIATQEERDEYDNYLMFSTLKDALRYGNGHVAWINATDAQIGELIRIADANTGRSSLLAKNVLCFFFGICYDDMEMRALETTTIPPAAESPITGQQNITVHPNPTDDILHVAVTDGNAKIAHIEMFDMFGRNISVKTHGCASLPSPQTTVNTSDIPSGLYILRVTLTNGTVRNVKVVRK